MDGGTIASILGAILVIAGIAFVAVQFLRQGKDKEPAKRSISAEAGPVKFNFTTTFPGLLVIALGVILLIVGAVAGR